MPSNTWLLPFIRLWHSIKRFSGMRRSFELTCYQVLRLLHTETFKWKGDYVIIIINDELHVGQGIWELSLSNIYLLRYM